MAETKGINTSGAVLDFACPDCGGTVKFNLMELDQADFQAMCPKCHRPYQFDDQLKDKFQKLQKLILAVREAEPILGDCNVAVAVPAGEVKVPYALLLTRLNTIITLNLDNRKVDFHLWIEPSSADTFR